MALLTCEHRQRSKLPLFCVFPLKSLNRSISGRLSSYFINNWQEHLLAKNNALSLSLTCLVLSPLHSGMCSGPSTTLSRFYPLLVPGERGSDKVVYQKRKKTTSTCQNIPALGLVAGVLPSPK